MKNSCFCTAFLPSADYHYSFEKLSSNGLLKFERFVISGRGKVLLPDFEWEELIQINWNEVVPPAQC